MTWACMSALWSAITLGAACASHAQSLRTEVVLPRDTDPDITGWLGAHFVAVDNSVPARNRLFVYLHGQGGTGGGATELVRSAAQLGLHAVGLTYPNDWSPFNLCSGGSDPNCAENLRREIIDGVDRSTFINVTPTESLQNRLAALIAFEHATRPTEGWGQFLANGQVQWDKVVVWGHSQGGGNAGVLARHVVLAGVCTSAPAADGGQGNPAPWWASHATPAERYFGLCHTQDAIGAKLAFWSALGMAQFGALQDVATTPSPYAGSHTLSTSVAPAVAGQYHNSVVADAVTPRDAQGVPVYKPVWQYMIAGALDGTGGGGVGQTQWDDVVFAVAQSTSGPVNLMMDVWIPTSGPGPFPLLVWIHGGGWSGGTHNNPPAFALALRERGVAVASIGYRLSGQAIFPAQIHDCKGAIRYLRAHAAEFNIDPARVVAWGSSAGGHLAALVATSGNEPALEGDTGGNLGYSSAVMAAVDYFGPTDLMAMQADCGLQPVGCGFSHDDPTSPESRVLGVSGTGEGLAWLRANWANPAPPFPEKTALATAMNPITHADVHDPPVFIAHGDVDTSVPLHQSVRMRDALRAAVVPATFTIASGMGHGFLGDDVNAAAQDWVVGVLVGAIPCSAADITAIGGTAEDLQGPDGLVTLDDILSFIDLTIDGAGCPSAERAPCSAADLCEIGGDGAPPDGQLTLDDILTFMNAFNDGC